MKRTGEKIGWIGGWLGSFLWVLILGVVWIVQGRILSGLAGLLIFGIATASAVWLTPWKHPLMKYWKLMLPLYGWIFLAAGLFLLNPGDGETVRIGWGFLPLGLLLLMPLLTMGNQTWDERRAETPQNSQ